MKTFIAKTAAVLAVPASVIGMVFGLNALGIPVDMLADPAAKEPATAADTTTVPALAKAVSPATAAIDSVFDQIDTAWTEQGRRVTAAGLPHPLTCVTPAPTISVSQLYKTKSSDLVQVTVVSYTAGLGAYVFDQMATKARDCKPSSTSMTVTPNTGLGVESARVQASWAKNSAAIEVVRRGDVITFTATSRPAVKTAAAVDAVVAAKIDQCVDQKSTVADAYRNLVTAKGKYTGLQRTEKVTIEPANDPTPEPGVEPVKVPAKTFKIPNVIRPSERAYPVWPDLPEAKTEPVKPDAPKPQLLATTYKKITKDTAGPGCGWAWMAAAQPPFNEDEATATNDKRFEKAEARLAADVTRWQADVAAYWAAYADYKAAVIEYRKYAEEVADVTAAWEKIDRQWADYWTDHANWVAQKQARDQFVIDKDAARATYKEQVAECEALAEEGQEVDQTPSTEPTAKPKKSEPTIVCPPVRPSILDQKAPKVGKEPKKPKNPRPDA